MSNGCETLTLADICDFLKQRDNYVVLTHASPDGDTLGSAYALKLGLKKLGKKVQVICCDEIPHKYDYFIFDGDCDFIPETVVAVDVADSNLLGALKDEFADKVELCIDHHISNTEYAKKLYLDSDAAAAAECIYDLIAYMRVNINDITAKAIYTALATDTGCFKYSNVTEKTHRIAASLYEFNIDASEINRLMFDTKSKRLLELEKQVLETAEFHFDDRCMLLTVTEKMQTETECSGTELEGIAVISRSVEGVKVGITLKQIDTEEFKISVRTYPPIDASLICKKLGGGGHKAAAGATVKGSLSSVKKEVLDVVSEALEVAYAGADSIK